MRVIVGSLQQETNTFSPVRPNYEDFDYASGKKMLGKIAATDVFLNEGIEIIPTIYAHAVPSGKLDKDSFLRFEREMVDGIPEDIQIDGVWLYLHGAMDVEEIGSGEVAILTAIRKKIGYQIPIAVAMDFHANNSDQIIGLANIICGYRTAPHEDMKQTEIMAAKLLVRCMKEKLLPEPVLVRIPMIIAGDKAITSCEPMKSVMDKMKEAERKPGMLSMSVFHGQNWVDTPNAGASVIAIAEHDKALAFREANKVAEYYWSKRRDFRFQVDAFEPRQAVQEAIASKEKNLVFLTDTGDNTTAGAAGDNAYLLKLLLESKAESTLVGGLVSKKAVEQCEGIKIGERISLIIGGEINIGKSKTVTTECVLKGRGNVLGWSGENGGRAAVLSIGGIDVILTAKRCAFISPEIFSSIGVDISQYKIIVVKLGYLYPDLQSVARHTIFALTPGVSCEDIEKLEFKRIPRPMYPFDSEFEWPQAVCR